MKAKNNILIISMLFFSMTVFAQRVVYKMIPNRPVDSVYQDIYCLMNPDPTKDKYGIAYSRKFGYLQNSKQFDTDSFFQWTQQFCIAKVGKKFFYKNFRLDYHSFKVDEKSEMYSITYLFEPFEDKTLQNNNGSFIKFTFRRYDFLGKTSVEVPDNLPDCANNPELCRFKYDRKKVEKIIRKKIMKGSRYPLKESPNMTLNRHFQWEVSYEIEKIGKQFTMDSRAGKMSDIKTSLICYSPMLGRFTLRIR